jgi:hypothetical protein
MSALNVLAIKRMKREGTDNKKIFAKDTSDEGLY